jgi:hypothetical protein
VAHAAEHTAVQAELEVMPKVMPSRDPSVDATAAKQPTHASAAIDGPYDAYADTSLAGWFGSLGGSLFSSESSSSRAEGSTTLNSTVGRMAAALIPFDLGGPRPEAFGERTDFKV